MANYVVTGLRAEQTARGVELNRIVGPGWAETPGNLLEHLIRGRHEFMLADTSPPLQLAARRHGEQAWMLFIVDPQGREVAPETLPHWQVETVRAPVPKRRNWWQRLLDPDVT